MNDGYADWLGIAPEGKFPVRKGTPQDAEQVHRRLAHAAGRRRHQEAAGRGLPAGGARRAAGSPDTFRRWGITQGQGALVGATLGELPVPKAVSDADRRRGRRRAGGEAGRRGRARHPEVACSTELSAPAGRHGAAARRPAAATLRAAREPGRAGCCSRRP